MPFCTNCGNQIGEADRFCPKCGQGQGSAIRQPSPTFSPADPFGRFSPRVASLLCYVPVIGWIASIIVLASPRYRADTAVRFHAFQGLCLFIVWLMVDWVISPAFSMAHGPGFGPIRAAAGFLHMIVFGAAIWMIIKTSQNEMFRLPILGDLADRLVAEQR